MASITYRTDKKTGRIYAYQSESFRDPITKKGKTKQKYLGVFDKKSGQIVSTLKNKLDSNKAISVNSGIKPLNTDQNFPITTKIVGPYSVLDVINEQLSIIDLLKTSFPSLYTDILSIVYYIVQTGDALSNCGIWSRVNDHPSKRYYNSQFITGLLDDISTEQVDLFLSLWLKKFINTEYLCYDITSISSYNKNIPYIKRGYSRDHNNLPQINLAMLFGQQSKLPAFYRRISGNIVDVQTLDTTINSLDVMGIKGIKFILDRGFFSQNNVDLLLSRGSLHFTLAVPIRRKWVEKVKDEYSSSMCIPANHYFLDNEEFIYCKTQLYKWNNFNRRLYLHIYYNDYRAIDDYSHFIKDLKEYKISLESKKHIIEIDERFINYITINETPVRGRKIMYNNNKILEYKNKYAGYFCILSTFMKDPIEALEVYRHRDVVEKCFDDIKNETDMKRIRTHTSNRMDSKLFLHFLASIFISQLRNITSKDDKLYKLSPKRLLNHMSTLQKCTLKGSYKEFYTETDKLQKHVLEVFNISWPF
jgi:transposase